MELVVLVIAIVCVFLIFRWLNSDLVSTKKSSPYLLDDGLDDVAVQKPSKPIQEPTARVPTVPKLEKIKEKDRPHNELFNLAEEYNLVVAQKEENRGQYGTPKWRREVSTKLIDPLTVDETFALLSRIDRAFIVGHDGKLENRFDVREAVRNLHHHVEAKLRYKKHEDAWNNGLREKAKTLVDKHYQALKRNYVLSVSYDDYGGIQKDDRNSVLDEFLRSVGLVEERYVFGTIEEGHKILDDRPTMGSEQEDELKDYLEKRIESDKREEEKKGFDPESIPEDGLEFEAWVADSLSSFGWQAKPTQGSGDQGIDVIAEKNGLNVGIQCKRYSGSVGNKAVQEVLAGMTHFRLDRGVVITNAKYTKSAKELAASSNILLLSHFDIPDLEAIFKDK